MKLIATLAITICIVGSAHAQGSCCDPHGGSGCADAECSGAVCALDPPCCTTEWDARCATEASVVCSACRPAPICSAPAAVLNELEVCGISSDDPCESTTGAPRALPLDTVAGGTVWATATSRDVDWFEVTLPQPSRLQLELWTSGPIGAAIVDTACPPTVHAESADGCPALCEACLPAGTWRIAIRSLLFESLGCGDPHAHYALRVQASPCQPQPPSNDRCDAAAIAALGPVVFDSSNASTEPAWLPPSCDEGSGLALTHDVWFQFTAPETARFTFATCGLADFDARIALYAGCGGDVLACSDDACADGGASMQAGLACGQTVLIRVGGWGHGSAGALQITADLGGGCDCPGDLDGSGEVDQSDASLLLLCYGDPGGSADLDGDGEVANADLGLLLLLIGPCN